MSDGEIRLPVYCGECIPPEKFQAILAEARTIQPTALDTETTGLVPEKGARVFGSSIANSNGAVFARRRLPLPAYPIFHNAKFDWRVLGIRHLETSRFEDTLLAARNLVTRPGQFSLKGLAKEFLGLQPDAQDEVKNWLKQEGRRRGVPWTAVSWKDVPHPLMSRYAAIDPADTYLLWGIFEGMLQEAGEGVRAAYTLDKEMVAVACAMEECGLPMSKPLLTRKLEFAKRSESMLTWRVKKGTSELANLRSPKQLLAALNKWHPDKFVPDTSFETLLSLYAATGDWRIDQILRQRQATKTQGYLQSYLDHICPDGRIHPSINLGRVISSRFSGSKPNLQQVKKPRDDRFGVRGGFRVPRGWGLLAWDLSQIEALEGAAIMGAPDDFLAPLNSGTKVYTVVCERLFGVAERDGERYDLSKAVHLAKQYLAGIAKTTDQVNLFQLERGEPLYTYAEVADIVQKYEETCPFIKRFMYSVERQLEQHGYVENPYGRRFYMNDEIPTYKYVNFLIQSSAMDTLKHGMRRVWEEFQDPASFRLALNVHDELLAFVNLKGGRKWKDWRVVAKQVQEIIESPPLPGPLKRIRVRSKCQISTTSWSQMKPLTF